MLVWSTLNPASLPINPEVEKAIRPYLGQYISFFEKMMESLGENPKPAICPCPTYQVACSATELKAMRLLIWEYEYLVSVPASNSNDEQVAKLLDNLRGLTKLLSVDLHPQP